MDKKLENKIKEIANEIMADIDGYMNKYKQQIEEFNQKLEKLCDDLTRVNVALKYTLEQIKSVLNESEK